MSLLALVAAAVLAAADPENAATAARRPADALDAPGFGRVTVHAPPGAPQRVVLLLSSSAGPARDGAVAEALAAGGALVASISSAAWTAAHSGPRCAYPAGDLEVLAQRLEKERGLEAYQRPFVVGIAEGATIAWAALAQAPPGTFAGAVAVDLCPDRPHPGRLCAGSGPKPRPVGQGQLPAVVRAPGRLELLSRGAGACPAAAAERLAAQLGAGFAAVPALPGERALPDAVEAALARAAPPAPAPAPARAPQATGVADLPLVEVPAAGGDPRLVVLLTGDGGWVGIDKALAAAFGVAGVATVGLDSLRYFWKRRTPDETAAAVARIVRHYGATWRRTEVLLVGYSRGADIVPFVAARMPAGERERLRLVALLGPGTFAEFEVHAIDLFSSVRRKAAADTEDAVRSTSGRTPMLCVRGSDEKDSLCPALVDLPWVKQVVLRGGHHFDGDYRELARLVLEAAPR